MVPAFPARANLSRHVWDALPDGAMLHHCAGQPRTKNTWFCSHFTHDYDMHWVNLLDACYEEGGEADGEGGAIFARPDVRLCG